MTKVFCIGANKTGTTSLAAFFRAHGYTVGDQAAGELLFTDRAAPDYGERVIALAATAGFFQDLPFSGDDAYTFLAEAYPRAKFILTKRSSAEVWYRSLTEYHAKKFGNGTEPPTANMLKKATYRYPGFMWDANRALYPSPPEDPYRKADLTAWYIKRISDVRSFFSAKSGPVGSPGRCLEIDIKDPAAAKKIAEFAGFEPRLPILPHLNRTE